MSAIKKQQIKKHPVIDIFFYAGLGFALLALIAILVWAIPHFDFKDPLIITDYATTDNMVPIISFLMLSGIHFGLSSYLKEVPDESSYGIFKNYVLSIFFLGVFITIAMAAYQW